MLSSLLQFLFVPSDDFFTSNIEDIKQRISEKIPYNDYVMLFETLEDIGTDGNLNIDLPQYKISDNLSIKQDNFIDFSIITKYRDTWYAWVRGFVFIFLIIYNVNQIMKLLRGISIAEGSAYSVQRGQDK